MEKRRLGKTGLEVSVLGFGASEIGERNASLSTVERLLGSALDAGLNVIDTAECYESSEELIGRAAGSRRKDYFILTKCGHASGWEFADWSPELIQHSIERSLKRLRTDYLDVMQLHSCGEAILRQGDVIAALQKARDAGKVRCIGYSGDGAGALYAVTCRAFESLQISISIADQEAIDFVLPAAIDRDIGIIAKRPIANAAWLGGASVQSYVRPYRQRLHTLRFDFLKHSADESVGKALRFTLSTTGVHTAIVGTSKPSRWEQNAELADEGALPPAEYEAIRARWREIAPADWVGMQ
jgi:aryl-alcohol dehydrogenase-like predicted oxidoreductase